ncbi:hypothetical protein LBMAG53_11100 [Planctomycetota bacterium]|nr:hypothetical protein LBMAG53_11100 [Planctomycetota bacterium]
MTPLSPTDRLPLTCTRQGTCCHGKQVWITPWELSRLAEARGVSARAFRDRWTADGGIRLAFTGGAGWRGLPACSQYAGSTERQLGLAGSTERQLGLAGSAERPLGLERQRDLDSRPLGQANTPVPTPAEQALGAPGLTPTPAPAELALGAPTGGDPTGGAPGCLAHAGRPLACRLYPLGRRRQGTSTVYLHEGRRFPCLDGCPSVVELPHLTVAEYVAQQQVAEGEATQDATLELAQDLAEAAFVLVFDSGLAASRGRKALAPWRTLGDAAIRRAAIGSWMDRLILPDLPAELPGPEFVRRHHGRLQADLQAESSTLPNAESVQTAATRCLAMALHLGQACGADPGDLLRRWSARASALIP